MKRDVWRKVVEMTGGGEIPARCEVAGAVWNEQPEAFAELVKRYPDVFGEYSPSASGTVEYGDRNRLGELWTDRWRCVWNCIHRTNVGATAITSRSPCWMRSSRPARLWTTRRLCGC